MNLYPPGVWLADAMASFYGVSFLLFCFVFVFMLTLRRGPSSNRPSICRRPDSHTCFFFLLFFFFIWRDVAFSEYCLYHFRSLCISSTSYVLSFRIAFFNLVTTGWIFDISLCENLCENLMNQSINTWRFVSPSRETKFSGTHGDRGILFSLFS